MAHTAQLNFIGFVRDRFPEYFRNRRVLEVGSLDINGSVRQFFVNCDYLGIDVGPGNGVDLVCPGQDYTAPDNTYDTVISTECFEHNPYWRETFANMIRMVKPHGLVIMSCATEGRKEHGTAKTDSHASPLTVNLGWGEYYQNLTEKDFRREFNIPSIFYSYQFSTNPQAFDLYLWGIKRDKENRIPIDIKNIHKNP